MHFTRRRVIVLLLALLLLSPLLLYCATWFIKLAIGYSGTGVVESTADLPGLGGHLSDFNLEGAGAYWFFWHPHGGYNYLLAGRASEADIDALCQRHSFSFSTTGNWYEERDWIDERLRDMAKESGHEDRLWNGSFADNDPVIFGSSGDIQRAMGRFRKSDGWFVINIHLK